MAPTLPRSDFTADGPKAWWTHQQGADTIVCTARGISVLAALQSVLWSAFRAPWVSYDGTHHTRPRVDGNFGPETMAALYAYAKKKNLPANILASIKADGQAHRISIGTLALAIWLTYYQPKIYDVDIENHRVQRTDPAEFGQVPGNSISIPNDAVVWKWLSRPSVGQDISTVAGDKPVCTLEGVTWSFESDALPPATPATNTSETGPATDTPVVGSTNGGSSTTNTNNSNVNISKSTGSNVVPLLLLLGVAGAAFFVGSEAK